MAYKELLKKIAAAMTAVVIAVTAAPVTSFAAMSTSEFEDGYTYPTEMRGLTAMQLVSDMGAGWNLGNSLESENDETYWGNPATTYAMIEDIAEMGFTTLRVPVRWDDHYDNASTYTINSSYMDRVETVVNYGLSNDMYVIVNVHHNDLQHAVPDTANISRELAAVWTQIGNRFKNYGDKLIFEVNNEPRGYTDGEEDWTGNAAYYKCVNECNEAARAAIRATGGNNTKRLVMLPTYCASGDAAKVAAWTKNESDNMIAASIHAYLPFHFAFSMDTQYGAHSDWRDSDLQELEYFFERMDTYFISKGIPVVIGEFGATNKNNTTDREKWAKTYISLARRFPEQDIPCVVWDNNYVANDAGTEQFKLYDRKSGTFVYEGIAEAITSGYNGDPDHEKSSSGDVIISSSAISVASWANSAFSSDYIASLMPGEAVKVQYTGDAPILILQSWSGGGGWVKVYPDSSSNGIATFSYETLVSEYGGSFGLLNQAYVSATEGSTTVTKIYIPKAAAHAHRYNGVEKVTLAASATTYGRKTVACSVSGCEAEKVVLIEPVAEVVNVPEAPVGLTATAGNGKVTLTWNTSEGAATYRVRRNDGSGWVNYADATGTSYVDTNVKNGTRYYYAVYAGKGNKWSEASQIVNAVPVASVVQNVSATIAGGGVVVKWNALSGATKYRIRRNDGSGWVNYVDVNATGYTDTNVKNGVKYHYAVYAFVGGTWTAASAIVNVTTGAATVVQNVVAAAGSSKITVSWTALPAATKYRIRRHNGVAWSDYADTTSVSYADTSINAGVTYKYAVYAYVNGKWGAASAIVSSMAETLSASNIRITSVKDNISLSWTAVNGAVKYRIRRNNGSGWVDHADLTATAYVDKNVIQGTVYQYAVYAYNGSSWSRVTAIIGASPISGTAKNVKAVANNRRIDISWSAVTGASKYRIRRNDGSGWVNYKDLTTTSYSDTNVSGGKTYRYAVYVYVGSSWGSASEIVSATLG